MQVVEGYEKANIPLETIWLDIPYLDSYTDFTINITAFPDIKNYTEMLHQYGKHLICILDAGISADNISNPYY
jgi:alpha-glucosidase